MPSRPLKIVLTGAPGSGKTSAVRALAHDPEFCRQTGGVTPVSEAATATYARLGTRWDRLDTAGRRDVQRAIYRLQLDHEAAAEQAARAAGGRLVLLDRGTIDGGAYWPAGPAGYWRELGTTAAAELARYDAVVLLETAAAVGAYDGESTNAVRFEDAAAAVENGRLLAELWSAHPRVSHVPAAATFAAKLSAVRRAVLEIIKSASPRR